MSNKVFEVIAIAPRLEWHEDRVLPDHPGPPRRLAEKIMKRHPRAHRLILYRKGGLCQLRWDATTWVWTSMIFAPDQLHLELERVGFGFTKRAARKSMEQHANVFEESS